jgi:hypothetical protein
MVIGVLIDPKLGSPNSENVNRVKTVNGVKRENRLKNDS